MFNWFKKSAPVMDSKAESIAEKNRGNEYLQDGNLEQAEACYQKALKLDPQHAEAYANLGVVVEAQGDFREAEKNLRMAIQIKPQLAGAYNNLGGVLVAQGRLDEAEECYVQAIRIRPDYLDAYSNLLFLLSYANKSTSLCFNEAKRYGQLVANKVKKRFSSWHCEVMPKRIRVGMVSGDFRNHPVGHFLEAILANIDPARFELFAYPTSNETDELTERIKPNFAAWKPLTDLDNENAAGLIHADCIHILVDLSGHTAGTRLPVFAWKPAPIQVSWLGYFATTGVAEMDYFVADPYTLPKSGEANYVEKIWRLPQTRLCFTAPDVDVPVTVLPALNNGYVTFACFNNLSKVNDEVVALWARVLIAVSGSRLFLKNEQLKDVWVRQAIIARFAKQGIAAERLILEGNSPRAEYLAAYNKADIALDPFPFAGGTTSVESLWMSVPVLSMSGETLVSRQGVGLLTNAGLHEWIATDADDYVARAVSHANDLAGLASLRSTLRQKVLASPIFDAPGFARHFETALDMMLEKWQQEHI